MWLSMAFPLKNDRNGILPVFDLSPKELKDLYKCGCKLSLHRFEVVPNLEDFSWH